MTSLTGMDYHPIGINPFCDMDPISKHYQHVGSNVGNYKLQILIRVDTTLCFSYSLELEGSRWRALFNL